MNKKFAFILEIVWLVLAILGAVAAIHKTYNASFKESYLMYIIAIICILMYFVRRGTRKISEKNKE
jgi:cytochrome bd-type quinol oxidase subunit 2